MNFPESARLWWRSITGPVNLVAHTVHALRTRNTVLLRVPEDVPWRKEMRMATEALLRDAEENLLISYIDCQDECPEVSNIGDFLLGKFAISDPNVRNGYRQASKQSIGQYILEKEVLKNRVLWIKGINEDRLSAWVSFCNNYKTESINQGLFVLECYSGDFNNSLSAHLTQIKYDDFVSNYDSLLFDNLLLANTDHSLIWKKYIAAVAFSLCGADVEVSEYFIYNIDFSTVEPVTALLEISEQEKFANRKAMEHLNPDHPFSLIRTKQHEELTKKLWEAQLQVIFPMIELERLRFTSQYQNEIEGILQTEYWSPRDGQSKRIFQHGELLLKAFDVEIGTLYQMQHLRKNDARNEYYLYLPNENDREHLSLLYEMRNALAHIKTCSLEQVKKFLSTYPYDWS
ncbi:MAG: hypothetical protein LBG04_04415 [Holosporaceae bacterium]|jgi:hypothetical protein|nr:hypothetical protein [Holosporaceae bacterium]